MNPRDLMLTSPPATPGVDVPRGKASCGVLPPACPDPAWEALGEPAEGSWASPCASSAHTHTPESPCSSEEDYFSGCASDASSPVFSAALPPVSRAPEA